MKTILIGAVLGVAAISQLQPDPGHPAVASGLLETNTLFTVYGRGFAIAPILGHLGTYRDIDAMAADTRTWVTEIASVNGGHGVATGIHLIST